MIKQEYSKPEVEVVKYSTVEDLLTASLIDDTNSDKDLNDDDEYDYKF